MIGSEVRSEVTEHLNKAFLTAYLLTRSELVAEQIVCQAIEMVDAPQFCGRALIAKTFSLCLGMAKHPAISSSPGSRTSGLPEQLKAVMELDFASRCCFVARVLLELPLGDCVGLLRTDAVTITKQLIEATQRLCRRSENNSAYVLPGSAISAVTYTSVSTR